MKSFQLIYSATLDGILHGGKVFVHRTFYKGHQCSNRTMFMQIEGMVVARDLKVENNNVIGVIGDGAMTAGQAYEAMNNAGYSGKKVNVLEGKTVSYMLASTYHMMTMSMKRNP